MESKKRAGNDAIADILAEARKESVGLINEEAVGLIDNSKEKSAGVYAVIKPMEAGRKRLDALGGLSKKYYEGFGVGVIR